MCMAFKLTSAFPPIQFEWVVDVSSSGPRMLLFAGAWQKITARARHAYSHSPYDTRPVAQGDQMAG